MRNFLIILLIIVLVLVLIGLNQYFGIWEINWTHLGIGIAASAGPLQFLKGKLDDISENKQKEEKAHQFRTMQYKEFMQRQQRLEDLQNYNPGKAEKKSFESTVEAHG